MKRTIIYVFGPKRLTKDYYSNKELKQDDGGWLKIGLTSSDDDERDKRIVAKERINSEVHTGIPEVCRLFDVFEYTEQPQNTDEKIRYHLTDGIFNLECSKVHNKYIGKDEIKAGREFVYGVTRNQVLSAIAKFERDLIMENYGKDCFDDLMKFVKNNMIDEPLFEHDDEEKQISNLTSQQEELGNKLWTAVAAKIKNTITINISPTWDRPYIDIKSPSRSNFFYNLAYSVRYGIIYVNIITNKGEQARGEMESYIDANNILSRIPDLELKQGAKNEKKWAWIVSDTLDKPFDELVDWFVGTILAFYKEFEY